MCRAVTLGSYGARTLAGCESINIWSLRDQAYSLQHRISEYAFQDTTLPINALTRPEALC